MENENKVLEKRKKSRLLTLYVVFVFTFLFFIMGVGQAWGASLTYYVDTASTTGGTCLSTATSGADRACVLPSAAVTKANAVAPTGTTLGAGHIIYVKLGNYTDGLTLTNANIAGASIIGVKDNTTLVPAAKGDIIFTATGGGVVASKNNITLKNLSFTGATGAGSGLYNNAGTGWVLDNVYSYDNNGSNFNFIGGATFTVTNSKFAGSGGNYNITISGTGTGGTISYSQITRSPTLYSGNAASILNGGTGTLSILNCVVTGGKVSGIQNSTTGITYVKNSYVTPGYTNGYALVKTAGELHALNNIMETNLGSGHEVVSGALTTDTANQTGVGLKAIAEGSAPYAILIPSIADNANLTAAQALEAALPTGKKGTWFLIGNDTTNQTDIQTLLNRGVIIGEAHGFSHSDVSLTAGTFTITKPTGSTLGTITVDRTANTITLVDDGGTHTVSTFKAKTLTAIKTEIDAFVNGANHWATGTLTTGLLGGTLGESLSETVTSTNIQLLIDATAATGYYKTEIAGAITALNTRFGITPRVFATPFGTTSANVEAAAKAAGYLGLRAGASTTTSLNSINAYQIYMYGALTYLHTNTGNPSTDIIATKSKIHAFLSVMSAHGGIYNVGADPLTDFTQAEWQALFDIAAEYPNIHIMDMGSAMAYIETTTGQWTTADSITWTAVPSWWANNWVNNLRLTPGSPAINAGVFVAGVHDQAGLKDYGNQDVYGTPDIGSYEYQPPYTFASNNIPTTGSARLYSDGKYMMLTASSTPNVANFSVTPIGGYSTSTTQYMDISIDSWLTSGTQNKQWTASSTAGDLLTQATSTIYTIGDLLPNTYYQFKLDGTASSTAVTGSSCNSSGSCLSNGTGIVTFTYNGGYSNHTFALTQDVTSPNSFTLISPANGSNTGETQSFSWNASSDTESGLSKYQLYIGNTLNKDNINSNSTSIDSTNVSCGSGWHIRAIDNNGNYTDSNTFSLGMPCGAGGSSSSAPSTSSGQATEPIVIATEVGLPQTTIPSTPTLESIQTRIASVVVEIANLSKNPSPSDLSSIQTKLLNIISELQSIQLPSTSSGQASFTKPLFIGMTDDDVKNLQTILKQDSSIYPEGLVTGYFGSATLRAVKRFQTKYDIAHEGDAGYGYVGPRTRGRLNSGN